MFLSVVSCFCTITLIESDQCTERWLELLSKGQFNVKICTLSAVQQGAIVKNSKVTMGTKLVQTVFGSLDKWFGLSRKSRRWSLRHTPHSSASPSTLIHGGFFFKGQNSSVRKEVSDGFNGGRKSKSSSAPTTPRTRAFCPTLAVSSQTLTDVLLKGCHDNTLKSPVCQRERKGLCACNHAWWCKTHTGSDFCVSNVQFGDESRAASVAITLVHLSCDALGLISSTLTRAPVWHQLQFVTLLSL